jgi:hypothetical protein
MKDRGQLQSVPASTRSCVPGLCVDAPTGHGGTGGWFKGNKVGSDDDAVTQVAAGDQATLNVTVLQRKSHLYNGTITLTWDPNAFDGPSSGSANGECEAAAAFAGSDSLTCTPGNLKNTAKSDGFTFTAKDGAAGSNAVVTATVATKAGQASATFPIRITG